MALLLTAACGTGTTAGAAGNQSNEGETAYRRCSNGHHHHLVCRVCGRTVEVSGPAAERWASAVAEEHGFRGVDLEIFGTCSTC